MRKPNIDTSTYPCFVMHVFVISTINLLIKCWNCLLYTLMWIGQFRVAWLILELSVPYNLAGILWKISCLEWDKIQRDRSCISLDGNENDINLSEWKYKIDFKVMWSFSNFSQSQNISHNIPKSWWSKLNLNNIGSSEIISRFVNWL